MSAGRTLTDALDLRDEVADKISRVNRASTGEKISIDHARNVAERLIRLGYINEAAVGRITFQQKTETEDAA